MLLGKQLQQRQAFCRPTIKSREWMVGCFIDSALYHAKTAIIALSLRLSTYSPQALIVRLVARLQYRPHNTANKRVHLMIQGSTELVAIVGSPIAQVKSPENFNRWFADHQQNVAMLAIDLAPSALQNFIQTLRGWQNMRGCVVTVPYKQLLANRLDSLSERSAALRSVNVIRREADGRLVGDIVDGEGFSMPRANTRSIPSTGRLVIGTGGVGSAIAYSLCQAGVSHLVISDLSQARRSAGRAVAQRLPGDCDQRQSAHLKHFDPGGERFTGWHGRHHR
jgi:hypothetical protein